MYEPSNPMTGGGTGGGPGPYQPPRNMPGDTGGTRIPGGPLQESPLGGGMMGGGMGMGGGGMGMGGGPKPQGMLPPLHLLNVETIKAAAAWVPKGLTLQCLAVKAAGVEVFQQECRLESQVAAGDLQHEITLADTPLAVT